MPMITHKGWFLACPVLLADIDTDCPYMETRRFIPEWWFEINAGIVDCLLFVAEMMNYEPMYPILISGELTQKPDNTSPEKLLEDDIDRAFWAALAIFGLLVVVVLPLLWFVVIEPLLRGVA